EPAGVVVRELRLAAHEVERCPTFAAGFGEDKRSSRKIERRQTNLARMLGTFLFPVQPPRDHQMQSEKQVPVQRENDPLAEPTQADDGASLGVLDRRIERTQEERIDQANAFQRLALDARREAIEVDDDIGEFGHGDSTSPTRKRGDRSGTGVDPHACAWGWFRINPPTPRSASRATARTAGRSGRASRNAGRSRGSDRLSR